MINDRNNNGNGGGDNSDRPSPIREDKSGNYTNDDNTIVDTHKPPTSIPSDNDNSESND